MSRQTIVLIVAGLFLGLPILSCGGCLVLAAIFAPNESPITPPEPAEEIPTIERASLIPGIEAVDVTLNLESRGFAVEKQLLHSHVEYKCSLGEMQAEVYGQSADAITRIRATAPRDSQGPEFLAFVATVPYSGGQPNLAKQWIFGNFGGNAEKTFGPCQMTLRSTEGICMLTIRPID